MNFSDTYTLTSSSVSRPFFGGLTYNWVGHLILNAESGGPTINVQSTAAATPLTINNNSSDIVNIGNGNLDSLAGAVTFNGGGGTNTVNVDDQVAPFSDTYTITSSGLAGPSSGA